MRKFAASLAVLIVMGVGVSGCGSQDHQSAREKDCNQQLDSIEQAFGRQYSKQERADNMKDCMADPKHWFSH